MNSFIVEGLEMFGELVGAVNLCNCSVFVSLWRERCIIPQPCPPGVDLQVCQKSSFPDVFSSKH
jgi:hypothetical protein